MRCSRARRLLQPLLDGELPGRLAEHLRAHLDTCAPCSQERATLRSLDRALADEPSVDAPSGLARAIARRAAARHLAAKRLLIPAWLEALTLGGTTIALAALGLVGVTLLPATVGIDLSPAMSAAAIASVVALGLAAFASSFYSAEV